VGYRRIYLYEFYTPVTDDEKEEFPYLVTPGGFLFFPPEPYDGTKIDLSVGPFNIFTHRDVEVEIIPPEGESYEVLDAEIEENKQKILELLR